MQQDELSRLREEVNRLNSRISNLEQVVRSRLNIETQSNNPPIQTSPQPSISPPPSAVTQQQHPQPQIQQQRTASRGIGFEEIIGGNWLAKIGVIIFVLGIAFFLKYAIENRLISEPMRVVIGLIFGFACLYAAEITRKKGFTKYANLIVGLGITVFYLTIYAASTLYLLIPQMFAFAFMFMITLLASAFAIRYDSISIAILGVIGGFATPVLLQTDSYGTGENRKIIEVLTYIVILDLGVLFITYYKNWHSLNFISFTGTALFFYATYFDISLGMAMLFISIYFVIFAAQSFILGIANRGIATSADTILVILTPLLYFLMSYSLLAPVYGIYMGLFTAFMAFMYTFLAYKVKVVEQIDRRLRIEFIGIATAFLIMIIPIQLKYIWIAIGWAGEAVFLMVTGFYLRSKFSRYVGIGLIGLSVLYLISLNVPEIPGFILFVNKRFISYLFVTASAAFMAWYYIRNSALTTQQEKDAPVILILLANFVLIWGLSLDSLDFVSSMYQYQYQYVSGSVQSLTLSVVWTLYAFLAIIVGMSLNYAPIRIMGISLLLLVITKLFLYDVWMMERTYRIILFIGLGIILLIAAYFYQSIRTRIHGQDGETGNE